jgi:uncharacterized protein YndB with AHSA1/START domain
MTEQTLRHLHIERTFDASPAEVWSAWTEPAQLAQWWGPDGFHTPIESVDVDLRPGGHLHMSMIETDSGTDYPIRFDVVEAVENELLVLFSKAQPEIGLTTDTTTRIEFADEDGKTRMTLTDEGWNQQFDKLVRLLAA